MASPAALSITPPHERHRPELTALYRLIDAHWPAFEEQADLAGGLPSFVRKQFEAYLDCGIAERIQTLNGDRQCSSRAGAQIRLQKLAPRANFREGV